MAKRFSKEEWKDIFKELDKNSKKYGFPEPIDDSALIGSFNIRKLGSTKNRRTETWKFLAKICAQFDLLAIQEVQDNLDGLRKLLELLGDEFGMVVSDMTGKFPGSRGVGERLAFIFRWKAVERGEVVSDVTYDRSKVIEILFENIEEINLSKKDYDKKLNDYKTGKRKTKPARISPVFLSFIRQPFCVSFLIKGKTYTDPYLFMAINAHLIFGTTEERKKEFGALMEWILKRVKQDDKTYYPNFLLCGDLNLDYNNPDKDFPDIEKYLKSFNGNLGKKIHVNFPFLDIHYSQNEPFTSNIKQNQRYDQIGLFFKDPRLPKFDKNETMGINSNPPDYGVFNFTELFCQALLGKNYSALTKDQKTDFTDRFENEVSDHMPIYLRLKLL